MIPISKLKLNPTNPRIIKDDKFKKLVQSLKDFPEMMEKRPLVCVTDTSDGKLYPLGGNMRLKALQELKYKEIPDSWVMLADDWTEEQRKEFIIKDNVSFGEWNFDELANNWEAEKLEEWGLDVPDFGTNEVLEVEEDDFEIPDEIQTDIVLGDLIEIGEHRLLCGDSTQTDTFEKLMKGELADMVVTDPPYNVNYGDKAEMLNEYEKGHRITEKILNDNMDDESFYNFLYDFYTEMIKVLKPGGAFYIFHAETESLNFRKALKEAGGTIRQTLIWVKNSLVLGRQDYQWKHEPCLYGWKEGAAHYFTPDRTKTTVIDDKIELKKLSKADMLKMLQEIYSDKTKTTVLYCDKPYRSAEHPTMKPILLIAPLIENSSKKGWIVLDSFLGSGSTMVAAHQLNRKCYGMELDPKYCDVIVNRMLKLDPTLRIKRNGVDVTKEWI